MILSKSMKNIPPNKAVAGMVISQAIAICPANPQRTMFNRSAAPAPTMDELITWVVLTGPPNKAALKMTAELATCDEKACAARIR